MKKLYFLLLLSFFIQKTNAQWVTIPDPNFVTFLQQNYPACMNGNQMDTTCSAIVNETYLICINSNISDLTGIKYFVNLEQLDCANNQLTILPDLPNSLYALNCDDNYLTYINSLPSYLYSLFCRNNNISYISYLPSSLLLFHCSNNNLTTLPQLPYNLQELSCDNNQLTSLPVLPYTIWEIKCNGNNLTSLPALPASLGTFWCFDNQLTSLPALPSNLGLLWCWNNQLSSLPALPNSLGWINCANNQILSLPTLPNFIYELNCSNNPQLACLPNIDTIYTFYFSNTAIQCLPSYGNVTNSNPPLNSLPLCSSTINAQITSTSTSLCGVSSITFSADTGTGYSYQWQLNGNNISGATSQTYDATVAGDYTVIVTYNCALDTSNTITITSGAAPSAAITASGLTSFCSGGSVTLDANTGTGLTYQWQLDGNNISGATSSSYTATATGNYSVMVSNNCGNSISNIITVNVTSAPGSAGTIAGPTSFCRHSTQTFSVTAVTGATNYVWSVPPQATIISGAGSNSITVSFKVKQGDVTVKPANQCGSGTLSVLPVQVLKCANPNSSINSPLRTRRNSEILLFPNPASSEVTIQFITQEENNISLKLYDIHGRIVMKQNSIAVEGMNEFTFDVEYLSKGVYVVVFSNGYDKVFKKLVIN